MLRGLDRPIAKPNPNMPVLPCSNQRATVSHLVSSCNSARPPFAFRPLHHLLLRAALDVVEGPDPLSTGLAVLSACDLSPATPGMRLRRIPRELFALKLQATRARVPNCCSPLKLLACPIHSQLLLVDRCHTLQKTIIHQAVPCWARDEDEEVIGCMPPRLRAMDSLRDSKTKVDNHIKDCLVRRRTERNSEDLERESPRIKVPSILYPKPV